MPEINGQYSMNPQLAQVKADQAGDTRATPEEAGYMELDGAQKDADCVLVSGGVSSQKGCCNLVAPVAGADRFTCGLCEKILPEAGGKSSPISAAAAGTSQAPSPSSQSVAPTS